MKRFLAAVAVAAVACLGAYASDEQEAATYIPSVLIVPDDDAVAELESRGVIIWYRRADMALAAVPRDMDMPARLRGKVQIDRERRAVLTMDKARPMFGADRIQTGEGLPHPYTGAGVVVGLCDTGIDPHHIAFLDAEGNSRVKRVVHYDETHGMRTVVATPEELSAWTTDNVDEYHGTHVANIMAGSYTGAGYQGMAPGADIVATSSQLFDAGVLAACEEVVAYAKEVGKPAVINLSLGNYNGPRDGTSLFCRYMDLLAEDAIVLLAAGNEANHGLSKRLDFSAAMPAWRVRLGSTDWKQFRIRGATDAWSADSRPVSVRVFIFDDYTNTVVYEGEEIPVTDVMEYSVSSNSDKKFKRYLKGSVRVNGGINERNGRWVTEIEYDTQCSVASPNSDGRWARYRVGFEFIGAPGTHADISSDGQYSWFNQWPGYEGPGNDLSLSDMCTGRNTISVGMYTSRNVYPTLDGEDRTSSDEPNRINRNSSYCTLRDGRTMPLTVAPGSMIVSACNSHFIEAHPEMLSYMCGVSEVDGKSYYWVPELGTSMSTPYVAGVVATWLEADPTLTVHDVQRVLEETNLRDCPDPENPRNGMGWCQPYEGLKKVLMNSGVAVGSVDAAETAVVFRGESAEVLNPSGAPLTVSVYGVDGRCVMPSVRVEGRVATVDLSALKSGMYVMTVADRGVRSFKFLRR